MRVMKKVLLVIIILMLVGSGFFPFFYFNKYSPNSSQSSILVSASPAPSVNIIIVGWDGVQRDHFQQCYKKELPECSEGLPNIKDLSNDKIYNLTISSGATETIPGWSQILAGYNAEITGILSNENYRPIPENYTIFEKAQNKFGKENIATIFIATKSDHLGGACLGDKKADGKIEEKGEPYCNTKRNLDSFVNGLGANDNVGNKVIETLEKYKEDRFLLYIHFQEPDVTGHQYGENSVEYSKAIINDDEWLGKIIDKLKSLNLYNNTYLYLATDHGFDENGKNHSNAPYAIFATNDKDVARSGDRKDIAPTILEKLGISLGKIDDASAVDGLALSEKDSRSCIPENQAYIDYEGAPKCCEGLTLTNLDKVIKGQLVLATGGIADKSGYCKKI